MKKILSTLRLGSLLIALGGICTALYLQHYYAYTPCALCILQRYIYLGVLLALLTSLFPKCYTFMLKIIVMPLSLIGIGIASYHIWVLHHPAVTCGRDILESKLNGLIFARWLPEVFEASGFCFDKYQPILGLDLPTWSLLGLGLIFCLAVIQLLNQKN